MFTSVNVIECGQVEVHFRTCFCGCVHVCVWWPVSTGAEPFGDSSDKWHHGQHWASRCVDTTHD